ncbi:MAG: histidine kinase [Pseudomonadota bacterium]
MSAVATARLYPRIGWRFVLLSLLGWSLLAAIPTTSAYLGTGARDIAVWWAMFSRIGVYYYLWGAVAPLLYRMTDVLPYRGKALVGTLTVHLLTLIGLSFVLGLIVHHDGWQEWLFGARAAGYHSMSAFTYALIVLCSLTLKFYRLSLLREREASEARILAAELDSKFNLARVDSLRMQLNPHFLFNALNSVGALIDTGKGELAYRAVEQLGDLLRRVLNLAQAAEVTLDEELAFCEDYLALEQVRFGDRLRARWQIEAETDCLVAAFVLQPVIENALRHAVEPSVEPVEVTVRARLAGAQRLVLEVEDDGNAVSLATGGAGVGLRNLRERLALHYGREASVEAQALNPGFRVRLDLPVRRDRPDMQGRGQD